MKLAIIGASTGQLDLCKKARQKGIETICFAWDKGAVCKDMVDKFYPISIFDKEKILEVCRKEHIQGVVSNCSDITAEVVSFISTSLHLHGIDYPSFLEMRDKHKCRNLTRNIDGLSVVKSQLYQGVAPKRYPCIIKPVTGASKQGVSFVATEDGFEEAILYAQTASTSDIIIEEYINGQEVSVESISFNGSHYVLQITDKESSGPPHFVELAHHQPSNLPISIQNRIRSLISPILNAVGFSDGASHIEMKVDGDNIYLIEINPRGGGDFISNKLVELSTGYDFLGAMIDVALGVFKPGEVMTSGCSGVYFLCKQSSNVLPLFTCGIQGDWLVEKHCSENELLSDATGNYDRNGYLIYKSNHRI